jgi:hypothetical protein
MIFMMLMWVKMHLTSFVLTIYRNPPPAAEGESNVQPKRKAEEDEASKGKKLLKVGAPTDVPGLNKCF